MSEASDICRLYLLISPDAGDETLDAFRIALDSGDVGCALLRGVPGRAFAERAIGIARDRDVAVLIENDTQMAKATGADGVHIIGDEMLYDTARNTLGTDAIIGAACGLSRHASLTLAERGADYIAIEGDRAERGEMVSWWAEIVEIPSVAWMPASLDEVRELARAGADFVAVDETLWRAGDDPREAIPALNLAIGERASAA